MLYCYVIYMLTSVESVIIITIGTGPDYSPNSSLRSDSPISNTKSLTSKTLRIRPRKDYRIIRYFVAKQYNIIKFKHYWIPVGRAEFTNKLFDIEIALIGPLGIFLASVYIMITASMIPIISASIRAPKYEFNEIWCNKQSGCTDGTVILMIICLTAMALLIVNSQTREYFV